MKKIQRLRCFLWIVAACMISWTACAKVMAPPKKASLSGSVASQGATQKPLEKSLLGRHMFSLQWISGYGFATFYQKTDGLYLDAKHSDQETGNYVTLNGKIKILNDTKFVLDGEVVTRVHYLSGGQACQRKGTFEFIAKQNGKYYRMQPEQNPCDDAQDYIDVFIK